MLKNKFFKYKLIRYKLVQHTLSTLYICSLYICALWISLSVLNVLSIPVVHASSLCADLVPSSSFKEQSIPTSKEQSAPTDFRSGSEFTPHGKNVLPLSSSSSGSTLGSSSSNALDFSLMNTLDFYSNFFNFSNSKTPIELTKNFQSYIGELLEKQIIGDSELIRFIEHLERGELINPISQEEALTSTPLQVQRRGLQNYVDKASLDHKELLSWSRATLAKRARVRVKREEVQEETRDPYRKLEFHPVKRPVSFEMEYKGDKKPVTLTHPIEVQSTPVTQKQWVEIMGENPSRFAKGEDSVVLNFHGKDIKLQPDNPVESVTFWSVLEFANRLSEKHGLPPAYDLSGITWYSGSPENGNLLPVRFDESFYEIEIYIKGESYDPYEGDIYYQAEGYRLPTAAEQAYMLLGGGKAKGDSFFKSKAEMDAYAWYKENADNRTHSVGLLQPIMIDGKDFYDLYGNVWEFGWDKYTFDLKEYGRKEKNPVAGRKEVTVVGRGVVGGGFMDDSSWFSPFVNHHKFSAPTNRNHDVGFRLVRTIKQDDGE